MLSPPISCDERSDSSNNPRPPSDHVESFTAKLLELLSQFEASSNDAREHAWKLWTESVPTFSDEEYHQVIVTFRYDHNLSDVLETRLVKKPDRSIARTIHKEWNSWPWELTRLLPKGLSNRWLRALKNLALACPKDIALPLICESFDRRTVRQGDISHLRGVRCVAEWIAGDFDCALEKWRASKPVTSRLDSPVQKQTYNGLPTSLNDDTLSRLTTSLNEDTLSGLPATDAMVTSASKIDGASTAREIRSQSTTLLDRKRALQHDSDKVARKRQQRPASVQPTFEHWKPLKKPSMSYSDVLNDTERIDVDSPVASPETGRHQGLDLQDFGDSMQSSDAEFSPSRVTDGGAGGSDVDSDDAADDVTTPPRKEGGDDEGPSVTNHGDTTMDVLYPISILGFAHEASLTDNGDATRKLASPIASLDFAHEASLILPSPRIESAKDDIIDNGKNLPSPHQHLYETSTDLSSKLAEPANGKGEKPRAPSVSITPSLTNMVLSDDMEIPLTKDLADLRRFAQGELLSGAELDCALRLAPNRQIKTLSSLFLKPHQDQPPSQVDISVEITTLLIPVHFPKPVPHWCLGCICLDSAVVTFYDPLQGNSYRDGGAEVLLRFATHLSRTMERLRGKRWTFENLVGPKQENAVDCGVFVIMMGFYRLTNAGIPTSFDGAIWRSILAAMLQQHADNGSLPVVEYACLQSLSVDTKTYAESRMQYNAIKGFLETLSNAHAMMYEVLAAERQQPAQAARLDRELKLYDSILAMLTPDSSLSCHDCALQGVQESRSQTMKKIKRANQEQSVRDRAQCFWKVGLEHLDVLMVQATEVRRSKATSLRAASKREKEELRCQREALDLRQQALEEEEDGLERDGIV